MKEKIASNLLKINAVSLSPNEPFTWSSGLKSPIYCDNRLTLSFPEVRRHIAEGFYDVIKKDFPEVDLIAGTATAGIAHAAFVSDLLDLPMCYVRSEAKSHGKGNQIEGSVSVGQKVVIVEDLISTAGSVIKVAKALQEAGCDVIGVVAIFTYELPKAREGLASLKLPTICLSDFTTLVKVAEEEELIEESELEKLFSWRDNPEAWQA